MTTSLAQSLGLACGALVLAAAGAAQADQLVLKNGDHLTGKIVTAADGKVQFTPDFAKSTTLTLDEGDIATFSTDGPVTLQLKDGVTLHQPIQQGAAGAIVVASGGTVASQPVPLAQVAAINPAPPPPVAWHGSLGANGLYSNAATSSLLIGISGDATRTTPKDTLSAHASSSYGQQTADHITTTNANNWNVGAKYDYNLSKTVYAHAAVEAFGDQVNALDLRLLPSLGVGYRWFDRADFHLTTDGGLSYIYEDYSTQPSTTGRTAISLSYHVDKSWDGARFKVFNDLQLLPTLEGGQFLAVTAVGLRTSLTKTMYSEIRADVSYDSDPAPGSKSTSSQLKLGLGWTY